MFTTPAQSPGQQYALAAVLSILPTIFTFLRFYARRLKKNALLWDDWLIVVALFFTYLTGIFMIIGTALGNQGQHMQFTKDGPVFDDPKYIWFLKMLWAGQLSQIFAIGPAKISVLLFYNRIFRGKTFTIINWVLIALATMWMIGYFFANLLECVPIERSFINAPGIGLDREHCIDAVPMYLSQVYSDLVLDALILVVPLPLIWKLHLPVKQKIAVCGIFLLGIMAVAASCAKMIIFNFVGRQLELEPDVSYFLTPIVYWPLIQAALQIVGACLPMLRPLIPSFKGSKSEDSGRDRSGYMISDDSGRKSPASQEDLYPTPTYGIDAAAQRTSIEHLPLKTWEAMNTVPSKGILVERAFETRSNGDDDSMHRV